MSYRTGALVGSLILLVVTSCGRPSGGPSLAIQDASAETNPVFASALRAHEEQLGTTADDLTDHRATVAAILDLREEFGSALDNTALDDTAMDAATGQTVVKDGGTANHSDGFENTLRKLANLPEITSATRPLTKPGNKLPVDDARLADSLRHVAAALLDRSAAAAEQGQSVARDRYRALAQLLQAEANELHPAQSGSP